MKRFEKIADKMKPAFEKIAANPYLSAIRDGFIASMPIILFSSVFLLIAYLPNTWGFFWSTKVTNHLLTAYNYSMGLLSLFIAATTSKNLIDYKNLSLPKTNRINPVSVMIASQIAFIILAVKTAGSGVTLADMGTQGLLAAYIVGLIVPNIYYVCIKNNVTIKMPAQVPQNISQTFKDLIPLTSSVVVFWAFDIGFRALFDGKNLPEGIIALLSPLFTASDSYIGLAIIGGAMGFFWFIGIQGPSIVQPAVVAFEVANTAANLKLVQGGSQAMHVLTVNTQDYVMNFGGTGATLVVAYLFLIVCKSKQLRALGKATFIPVSFGVNEPVLFGAPMIMNPIFFLPMVLTPMLNVVIFKFFVTTLGMNSMIYTLPWTIPGPIGIIISTGLAPLSFIAVALMLVGDVLFYLPFVKIYDNQLLEGERKEEQKEQAEKSVGNEVGNAALAGATNDAGIDENNSTVEVEMPSENKGKATITKETNVLVLCAGGGTSGILANALNKVAKERNLPLHAAARAYGQDMDLIHDMDLVILAPQMESMKGNLKKITDAYDVQLLTTTGKQYIELTRDADKAIKFVADNIK
ncbi:PTS lactose transporter subunit IIBC [Pediococcus cellicola]|uniref:PTS system lactose-specific EIICB component n=1 Tax=Pediococcus cellicola TaxID=319652 RepID=A0A0R2IRI2_9LACO|nr:PTS lactose transporter subunit IIBC [Pediococcus cellicola]KRN67390.1 phosphoenolpyruvate-dependent sugar phosphotransferase system EIIBC, lactose specific [Pediococcus cellicola]GEL15942.1 PTS lactose transporter subunit IIB [Pediococcus cellicola]